MKEKRIALIIFGVIAALAVVCVVFPENGIHCLGMDLRFPSVTQVLVGDTISNINPEEELARLEEEQANIAKIQFAKEDSAFISKLNNSTSRIYFPKDDVTYFDSFFAALDSAKTKSMRIIHYGDSQLEIDRITCEIREMLQEKFGGNGVGWLPIVNMSGHYTVNTSSKPELNYGLKYSFAEETKPRSNHCGPYCNVAYLNGGSVTMNVNYSGDKAYPHIQGFKRLKVFAGSNKATVKVTCNGVTRELAPTDGLRVANIDLSGDSLRSVNFTISGNANLYGVSVEGANGVTIDNVPMRGCTGTIFSDLNELELKDFFAKENVPLIILQFGGNAVPGLSKANIPQLMNLFRKQLDFFHRIAPKSKLLFIGPSDMATSTGGSYQSYKHLAEYNDSIRKTCVENGAAFWDMYAVMGGKNSMVSWVKNNLAGKDYIHFTRKGSEKIAKVFNTSLNLYYDYYSWRRKEGKNVKK